MTEELECVKCGKFFRTEYWLQRHLAEKHHISSSGSKYFFLVDTDYKPPSEFALERKDDQK